MSKQNSQTESIYSIFPYLKKDSLLPIYFFYGDDFFTIDNAVKAVRKAVEPLLESDFDFESIRIEKKESIHHILDIASAFPFGGSKKLIIVKNFEKISEKENFVSYIKNPPEFTILVITQTGKITKLTKEPYATLNKFNYLFEAKELKGNDLIEWLIKESRKNKLILSVESALALVETVGEDKALLEMQLQKIFDFLGEEGKITSEVIQKLASVTKEFTIFNLQDALGLGDKSKSIEIAYNMIDNGKELVFITTMLTKYISTIARSIEFTKKRIPDNEAAKEIGVSNYYYSKCKRAKVFLSDEKLLTAARALYKADSMLKTSQIEGKTLLSILISDMFS
jgi:DNA polymerase-3 subunit delta